MKAKIYIKYKEGILDPQGKTVHNALESMEISTTDLKIMKSYFEKTATVMINS